MSESLKDGEHWLPRQLLYPDDFHMDNKFVTQKGSPKGPFGIPYGFGSSDITSPVGSTEIDNEENDISFLAGLTQQLANSSLLDDGSQTNDRFFPFENSKSGLYPGWFDSGSTQSGLYTGGCGCRQVSSANEPTTKPQATWELLCAAAAAAEVERMKLKEESYYKLDRDVLGPTRKPNHLKNTSVLSNMDLYHKLQVAYFQQLKEQQFLKQKRQSGIWGGHQSYVKKSGVSNIGSGGRTLGLSTSSSLLGQQQQQQQLRQQFGSGKRAVYPVGKRECAGTGVFLPRRVGPTATEEPRKKSVGPTVLLPARVVQALNLNLDEMGPGQPRFTADGDAALWLRSGDDVLAAHQKRGSRAQAGLVNAEIKLPQEWSY